MVNDLESLIDQEGLIPYEVLVKHCKCYDGHTLTARLKFLGVSEYSCTSNDVCVFKVPNELDKSRSKCTAHIYIR